MAQKAWQAVASHVAKILRAEREKQGLSLSKVAERAGLSYQMISYVEREMASPTLETLLRITTAMDISLAEVIRQAEIRTKKNGTLVSFVTDLQPTLTLPKIDPPDHGLAPQRHFPGLDDL